jgi:hypothetical protein
MRLSRSLISFGFGLAFAAALVPSAVFAQAQDNLPAVVTITNTARPPNIVQSLGPLNSADNGVICTFNQASHTGSPSTTIEIDFEDPTSNTWQQAVVSGAITADTTPTSVMVYPGIQTSSLPTGMVAKGIKLPPIWSVKQSQTTGGATITGTTSCDLLK